MKQAITHVSHWLSLLALRPRKPLKASQGLEDYA